MEPKNPQRIDFNPYGFSRDTCVPEEGLVPEWIRDLEQTEEYNWEALKKVRFEIQKEGESC